MTFDTLLQYNDHGLFILRLVIGIIFIYHALPKLKNSQGMAAMMGMQGMGMMVLVLGVVELVAGIAVILGWRMQLAALALGIVMVGAIGAKMMKWNVPFAAGDKTGWEFDLMILAGNVVILLGGGGSITLL